MKGVASQVKRRRGGICKVLIGLFVYQFEVGRPGQADAAVDLDGVDAGIEPEASGFKFREVGKADVGLGTLGSFSLIERDPSRIAGETGELRGVVGGGVFGPSGCRLVTHRSRSLPQESAGL